MRRTLPLTRLLAASCAFLAMAASSCTETVIVDYEEPATAMVVERADPDYGAPGDAVAIMGRNFGDTSKLVVHVGTKRAEIVRVMPDRMYINVPEGAGNNIRVQRTARSSSVDATIEFTIIPSPHNYNRWSIDFEKMPGTAAWSRVDQSGDTVSQISSPLIAYGHSRSRVWVQEFNGCATYGNGDTVRICTREHSTSTTSGSGAWSGSNERYELVAVVDTVRRVLSHVTQTLYELVQRDESSSEGRTTRYDYEIVLRDMPYVISDGVLTATLEGATIGSNIVRFRKSIDETIADGDLWYRTREEVLSLAPAADTRIVVTLQRHNR